MHKPWHRKLLLTGAPGVGKTSCILRVLERLPPTFAVGGLLREDVVEAEMRVGFRARALGSAQTRMLAHADFISNQRAEGCGVDVEAINYASDLFINGAGAVDLMVIDPIGKMEFLSAHFARALKARLADATPLLASVAPHNAGLLAKLTEQPHIACVEVTPENRDVLDTEIVDWLLGQK